MAKRKTYRITFPNNFYVCFYVFVRETRGWGISGGGWLLNDKEKAITTTNKNVIDVVTETFQSHDYQIEAVERG